MQASSSFSSFTHLFSSTGHPTTTFPFLSSGVLVRPTSPFSHHPGTILPTITPTYPHHYHCISFQWTTNDPPSRSLSSSNLSHRRTFFRPRTMPNVRTPAYPPLLLTTTFYYWYFRATTRSSVALRCSTFTLPPSPYPLHPSIILPLFLYFVVVNLSSYCTIVFHRLI